MRRHAIKIAVLLLAALLLAGCGSEEQTQEKRTICVVLKAMDSVHWLSVEDGLKSAANDYGVSVNILWPSHEDDVEAQNTILQDVIDSEPDAIAVSPCDSDGADVLGLAAREDIPCFYIDTVADRFDFPYIGANNHQIGVLAAKALDRKLGSGKVAVITGSRRQSTHEERLQGFTDYIEQYTDLELCAVEEAESSSYVEGTACMEQLMRENPDIEGVFCTSAVIVLGAMQQLERTGGDVQLVGVDMQSDAMAGVEDGKILALVGQNGYEIGYQTVANIVHSLDGEEISHHTYVETPLITQGNVAEYLEKYLTERGESDD